MGTRKEKSTSPRGRPRGYHHGDLRTALIDAALDFLKTEDPTKLSLRDLALGLGVSQAAPYRHFKEKEELLAAICEEGFKIKFEMMKQALQKHRDSPLEAYYALGDAYLRMGLEHPQHFQLMMSGPVKPSLQEGYPGLRTCGCRNFALLKLTIERAQAAGALGPGDSYLRAVGCWTIVHGFTSLYSEGRLKWLGVTEKSARQMLRSLIEHTRQGLANPPPPTAKGLRLFGDAEGEFSLKALEEAEWQLKRELEL
jgi:AcrR family transcriptional regulator